MVSCGQTALLQTPSQPKSVYSCLCLFWSIFLYHIQMQVTLKTPFFFFSFFFWGVRPPLNPPLFEVLFRRDTCILLFPFKPKTLPFEDETKMPLFSLQGYLKTLKCFDTYSCGNLTLVEYHWKRFSMLMDSVLFPDEVLCATLRVFNMALLWKYQHLDFILKQECLGLFSFYLFVQFQPLFW